MHRPCFQPAPRQLGLVSGRPLYVRANFRGANFPPGAAALAEEQVCFAPAQNKRLTRHNLARA
jgi:hypothetical protein